MKGFLKWGLISLASLVVLVVAALLVVPRFLDLDAYKPQIVEQISRATGRPASLDGRLNLSLFPWVSVSFEGFRLESPPGFSQKDFLEIREFDLRLKLLPLLSRRVEIQRLMVRAPRLALERNAKGQGNWQGIGKGAEAKASPSAAPGPAQEAGEAAGLPIQALGVGELTVRDAALVYMDQASGTRREIDGVNLDLRDVSLTAPIAMDLTARLDGQPIRLSGQIGPLGPNPGQAPVHLDLKLAAFDGLVVNLQGSATGLMGAPVFDIALDVPSFAPRKVLAAAAPGMTLDTADPKAFESAALKARASGGTQSLALKEGRLNLDQSQVDFDVSVKDFERPSIRFDLNLDRIDADRYLPPAKDKAGAGTGAAPSPGAGAGADFSPLRRLVLEGRIGIGQLKVYGARVTDVLLQLSGRDGLFQVNPMGLKCYQGGLSGQMSVDFRKSQPGTGVTLKGEGIQVNPLMQDMLAKDFLEGKMRLETQLQFQGLEASAVKRSLNGEGELLFSDGAFKGIDLNDMVNNVKQAFGKAAEGPAARTDFSELRMPFVLRDGVFETTDTSLKSPVLRVLANGKADLAAETLDFRVEPKFVGTLKGQGDTVARKGITVPVLVTGTFNAPKFAPDLGAILQQGLSGALPLPGMPSQGDSGSKPDVEEKGRDLLKKLPFGR